MKIVVLITEIDVTMTKIHIVMEPVAPSFGCRYNKAGAAVRWVRHPPSTSVTTNRSFHLFWYEHWKVHS